MLKFTIHFLNAVCLILCAVCNSVNVVQAEKLALKGQVQFATPEKALEELKTALRKQDSSRLVEIFGRPAQDFFQTGDPVSDKITLARISKKFEERAVLVALVTKAYAHEQWFQVRYGVEAWPLRIPLASRGEGYFFATDYATDMAMKLRRSLNEITTVDTLRALVQAQLKYYQTDHDGDGIKEYALKLISDPGKHDGLYWPSAEGEDPSPLDGIVANAIKLGYGDKSNKGNDPTYEGYRYRIIAGQTQKTLGGAMSYLVDGQLTRGFAILAYPVKWRSSGDMTFVIRHDNLIWQKDLGFRTTQIATDIEEINIDSTWTKPNPMVADLKSRINW